jgi:hypothetical protein
MSGTYPFTPVFETVNFKINTPTLTSETLSGKRRRVGMGHSFYTFSAKYSNVRPYDFGVVTGFIASQYGALESFQIVVPVISFSKSPTPPSTTPATTADLPIGNNSIALTNCGNAKMVLAAGDFFKFANHTKVYMCVTDCVSNSSGVATLYFSGSAVTTVPSGTALTITQVPFTVILDGDVQEYTVGTRGVSTMTVNFREVW